MSSFAFLFPVVDVHGTVHAVNDYRLACLRRLGDRASNERLLVLRYPAEHVIGQIPAFGLCPDTDLDSVEYVGPEMRDNGLNAVMPAGAALFPEAQLSGLTMMSSFVALKKSRTALTHSPLKFMYVCGCTRMTFSPPIYPKPQSPLKRLVSSLIPSVSESLVTVSNPML